MAETSLMFLHRGQSKECGLSVEKSHPRAEVQWDSNQTGCDSLEDESSLSVFLP